MIDWVLQRGGALLGVDGVGPEELAAFLDGRLAGEERARVVAALAADPELHETMLEAAAVGPAVESADSGGGSGVPLDRAQRTSRRWAVAGVGGALLAAGLAALVLVPRIRRERWSVDSLGDLGFVKGRGPGSVAAQLGENWDQPGWSVVRGGPQDLEESARAFRLGARVVDLEVASRAADAAAVRLVAADLNGLLAGVEAGAPVAALFQRVLEGQLGDHAGRRGAAEALRRLLGNSVWFELGAWTEGARLAIQAGRADLAGTSAPLGKQTRSLIPRFESLAQSRGQAVAQMLRTWPVDDPPSRSEWPAAEAVIDGLVRLVAY